MSEFKRVLLAVINKYYPEYEYIEISIYKQPLVTSTPKVEVTVVE